MTIAVWNSDRLASQRLKALLSGVHAGDRLTTEKWFAHILEGPTGPSSNVEAQALPFQRWFRFKEAFSPRFVSTAIASLDRRPKVCVDPFGGSGTTALTCQFLGIEPATIEVNPFLADLIEAKLSSYNLEQLIHDYAEVVERAKAKKVRLSSLLNAGPATLVEPGVDGRWIFDRGIAKRLLMYREAIDELSSHVNRRLFRVTLGAIAVRLSNVVVSGKGRRYRSNWTERKTSPRLVDEAFRIATEETIQDISRFGRRAEPRYQLFRGDSRELTAKLPAADFALFSPPYPNSFDYTDIYNVELWLLGYLQSSAGNRVLREATLRSHVQVKRSYEGKVPPSKLLAKTIKQLQRKADELWDSSIPAMANAYFVDIAQILSGLSQTMTKRADVMMVVGDSRYAGVRIDVATICAEIAPSLGFSFQSSRPIRAMRASAQQGGHHILTEALLHLKRL